MDRRCWVSSAMCWPTGIWNCMHWIQYSSCDLILAIAILCCDRVVSLHHRICPLTIGQRFTWIVRSDCFQECVSIMHENWITGKIHSKRTGDRKRIAISKSRKLAITSLSRYSTPSNLSRVSLTLSSISLVVGHWQVAREPESSHSSNHCHKPESHPHRSGWNGLQERIGLKDSILKPAQHCRLWGSRIQNLVEWGLLLKVTV